MHQYPLEVISLYRNRCTEATSGGDLTQHACCSERGEAACLSTGPCLQQRRTYAPVLAPAQRQASSSQQQGGTALGRMVWHSLAWEASTSQAAHKACSWDKQSRTNACHGISSMIFPYHNTMAVLLQNSLGQRAAVHWRPKQQLCTGGKGAAVAGQPT